jgi:TolA-binding protein
MPPPARRQALLKIIELSLAQNKIADAAERLEQLLGQYPDAPSADFAWQTLGEVRLRQYSIGPNTNRVYLAKAREAFGGLAKNFPQSPLLGKGQMYLGWCFWLDDKWSEAQKAFQSAAEHLPPSADQAFAYFKLADSQFRLSDFTNALKNYTVVIETFKALPEAQTNLIERALYQAVRTALAATNLTAATNLVAKILACYPNGYHTECAVLLTGQEISRQGDAASARKILSDFAAAAPNAAVLPEVQLAIAHTYKEEERWPEAIRLYEVWLGTYTNHPAQPQAEYDRAWATFKSGDDTNALRFFTNLIAHFPSNELTARAQWWVGEHYLHRGGRGDLFLAEEAFQPLFLGSNHLDSEMACRAQMMAGLAAKDRQGYGEAEGYFTNVANKASCPMDLRLQARFAYADVLTLGQTPDFKTASLVFGSICDDFPTNGLAAAAWGRKAECLLQHAQTSPLRDFEPALIAFQQVTNFPNADAAIRAQAKLGQALVMEKQAEAGIGEEQTEKRKLALNLCLDVLYDESDLRDGGKPSLLFWTQKAGLQAAHLAELMQDWRHAKKIYERLQKLLPVLSASLDKKILNAQEKLDAGEKVVP